MKFLSPTTTILYSELLQQSLGALPSERGVSYYTKHIHGRDYWYAEFHVGATRRQVAIGPDSEALRARIADHRDRVAADAESAAERERLVAMLRKGGAARPDRATGRVLEALERIGVFQVGGVLVDSHAFAALGNLLGVSWTGGTLRTQDMDVAMARIAVGVGAVTQALPDALDDTGLGFFPVPGLDRRAPSTAFRIRGQTLHVDLLTPLAGPDDGRPRYIPAIKTHAAPLRFLGYLIEDPVPAVVVTGRGVLVNVPDPARFALHKLVVAERRVVRDQAKARKDRAQADAVIEVLAEDRPGDLALALDASLAMPKGFRKQLSAGIARLAPPRREALADLGARSLAPAGDAGPGPS